MRRPQASGSGGLPESNSQNVEGEIPRLVRVARAEARAHLLHAGGVQPAKRVQPGSHATVAGFHADAFATALPTVIISSRAMSIWRWPVGFAPIGAN